MPRAEAAPPHSKPMQERVQFVVKGKRSSRLFFREDLKVLRQKIAALETDKRRVLNRLRDANETLPSRRTADDRREISGLQSELRGVKHHLARLEHALAAGLAIDRLRGYLGVTVRHGVNVLFWAIPMESVGQVVCIGSVAKLRNVDSGAERTVMITGWRDGVLDDDALPYYAPLAQALLGAKKGDVRSINGTKASWKVVTIFSAT